MLYTYAKTWLPDDLLAKADRMTMAHSIELRVPFLDNDLVSYVATLPQHLKVKRARSSDGWQRKFVLRKALEGRVPQTIIDRPKQGFPVPAYGWLAGDLRDFAKERLTSSNLTDIGFERSVLADLMDRSAVGDGRAQRQAWVLIILSIWAEQYLR